MMPLQLVRDRTVHVSRTMMLGELSTLLESMTPSSPHDAYRQAILEENLLLKRTVSNREKTLRFLRELYALDPADPIFAPLSSLWQTEPSSTGRALLALLAAAFRDELLRPTVEQVLITKIGEPLAKEEFAQSVAATYPDRFGQKSLDKIGRNIAATWTQSGHLQGRIDKRRAAVSSTPAATVFAFYLGWLEGHRGLLLYTTSWANLLDAGEHQLDGHLFAASQRGWLDYKRIGDVVEIDLEPLTRLAAAAPTIVNGAGSRPVQATHALTEGEKWDV